MYILLQYPPEDENTDHVEHFVKMYCPIQFSSYNLSNLALDVIMNTI